MKGNMMKSHYEVQCEHCEKMTSFRIDDVARLDADIDDEVSAAKSEVAVEFEGMVEPDELLDKLQDLSSAIRAGDRIEAEHLLDKLASEIGSEATEYVQRGRFSMRAVA